VDAAAPFEPQSLILPDTLTVSQFVDRHRPSVPSSVQRLAFAILDLSVHDLGIYYRVKRRGRAPSQLNTGLIARKSRNHKDALAWLRDVRSEDLFSFNSCCELLSIDPGLLRRRLLELLAGASQ